jgi:hypothetical protein
MEKKSVYLNQRIRKDVVKELRKYERANKLKASVSSTIEHLLHFVKESESFISTLRKRANHDETWEIIKK